MSGLERLTKWRGSSTLNAGMRLEEGALVTGAVRLVRPLKEGGMGSVWLAEHLSLRTSVVVKFMASDLVTRTDAVARFSREAAIAAQVRSPHVVSMLDHGVVDGTPYIIMEHLEGEDLGGLLARRGIIPPADVDEIVRQLAARSRACMLEVSSIATSSRRTCSSVGRSAGRTSS